MGKVASPRLIDVFGSDFTQEDVEFAIPRLHEDIPLCVDPFLLWSSEKPEYQELHKRLLEFFHLVSHLVSSGDVTEAANLLARCAEHPEIGLGYAGGSKRGSSIGPKLVADILQAHENVPQLAKAQLRHIEELQLVVPGVAEDRVSDIAISILMGFFIEFSQDQATQLRIPTRSARIGDIYDPVRQAWVPAPEAELPYNPENGSPLLLAPLDLLRHLPWINYRDYYRSSYAPKVVRASGRRRVAKAAVLAYNARNYVEVVRYVDEKENAAPSCHPDPLFRPLAAKTLRSKFSELRGLQTGRSDGSDRRYEDLVSDILSSVLYPTLEFAESRVRTVRGVHILDLIFYNDGKTPFWVDLRDRYEARQPVFELKNVRSLRTEHVNQLHRYLDEEFGRFGILVTRNPTPRAVQRNIVDLHSSKRVAVICLDDRDLELMLSLLDSGRDPSDAVKKKFVEFSRLLPK